MWFFPPDKSTGPLDLVFGGACNGEVKLPGFLHLPGGELGEGPFAPEHVDPPRSPDRAARVLVQGQAAEGDPSVGRRAFRIRPAGGEKTQRTEREDPVVGGDR